MKQAAVFAEGPEPLKELKQAQTLFIDSVFVGKSLQLVIQLDSQLAVGCDYFHISPTNADMGGQGFVPAKIQHQ